MLLVARWVMRCTETSSEIKLDNILYLTDFSEPADAALPFATALAREYGSSVYAVHVLRPDMYTYLAPEFGTIVTAGLEQAAKTKMQQIESRLNGLPHQSIIEWGTSVWSTAQQVVQKNDIDLVVVGTHGRRGLQKFFLGSVAEEIWRRASVPVLTIGPSVSRTRNGERLNCVLFVTDFTSQSLAGLPYAVAMAREYRSHLVLLHVIQQAKADDLWEELTAAEAIYHLSQTLPRDAKLSSRPELVIKHGEPAKGIIDTARSCNADLIVLGVRGCDHPGIATHDDWTIAHEVLVNATCPILMVPGASAALRAISTADATEMTTPLAGREVLPQPVLRG